MTVPNVPANALWLVGLAGLLAAAGYLQWYRQMHRWPWRRLLAVPRARMPLALSLTFVCAGVTLNDLLGKRHDPGWAVVGWVLLFILFSIQTVFYARAGDQHGWDSSTRGNDRQ